jgi:hypothetical protein
MTLRGVGRGNEDPLDSVLMACNGGHEADPTEVESAGDETAYQQSFAFR